MLSLCLQQCKKNEKPVQCSFSSLAGENVFLLDSLYIHKGNIIRSSHNLCTLLKHTTMQFSIMALNPLSTKKENLYALYDG